MRSSSPTADAYVATEDRPNRRPPARAPQPLRRRPRPLLRRSGAGHAADDATRRSPATYPADDSSSGSPGPTAAHSSVCSTSAHEANVRRWIEVVPDSAQAGPVLGRGVPLVVGQVVPREPPVELDHEAVAGDLGDDGRSRDRRHRRSPSMTTRCGSRTHRGRACRRASSASGRTRSRLAASWRRGASPGGCSPGR